MKAIDIATDRVFVGGELHRRVLGVINARVRYSFGGDRNRDCKVETFLRWARRVKAVRVK